MNAENIFLKNEPPPKNKKKTKTTKEQNKTKNRCNQQFRIPRCPFFMPPKPFTKKNKSVLDFKHTKTINCKKCISIN